MLAKLTGLRGINIVSNTFTDIQQRKKLIDCLLST